MVEFVEQSSKLIDLMHLFGIESIAATYTKEQEIQYPLWTVNMRGSQTSHYGLSKVHGLDKIEKFLAKSLTPQDANSLGAINQFWLTCWIQNGEIMAATGTNGVIRCYTIPRDVDVGAKHIYFSSEVFENASQVPEDSPWWPGIAV